MDSVSLGDVVSNLWSADSIKIIVFLFIIYILINSNVFIDKILGKINGAVEYKTPTTKGVIIQSTILVLLYMCMDVIINMDYI